MAWVYPGREGGEPMSKGPTVGKVKSGITFFWEELWEILRDHQPYQRNSRELQNKLNTISRAAKLCAKQGKTCLVIHGRRARVF
jgi:hypothetical protein